MRPFRPASLAAVMVVVSVAFAPPAAAQLPASAADSAAFLLDRFAFGPAPGQIDEVVRRGVLLWFDDQLRPASDPRLESIERQMPVLRTSRKQLARLLVADRDRQKRARELAAAGDSSLLKAYQQPPRPGELRELAGEMPELTLERAVEARESVREVLADFWFNHFNVYADKNNCRVLLPEYVERVIRPHVFGRFADLLEAVAESPAMLVYLDNASSVARGALPPQYAGLRERAELGDPQAMQRLGDVQRRTHSGINENFARELMELHTLGVDGGYGQADVDEVARILTGWSVAGPQDGMGFEYRDWAHDDGEKVVLGRRYPKGHGRDEGRRLLQVLAAEPATVQHVCHLLCERFVAEEPPDGVVDAMRAAWVESHGDLRVVLQALVRAPEFWQEAGRRNAFKSPLEFTASALRAVGASFDSTHRAANILQRLGEPLYRCAPPTGYGVKDAEWATSGALLERMNIAVALAADRLPGVHVRLDDVLPASSDPDSLVAAIDRRLLGGTMTERTRGVIRREIAGADAPHARALAVGLALGGPEFQRR